MSGIRQADRRIFGVVELWQDGTHPLLSAEPRHVETRCRGPALRDIRRSERIQFWSIDRTPGPTDDGARQDPPR
jgi:hypothetical protein